MVGFVCRTNGRGGARALHHDKPNRFEHRPCRMMRKRRARVPSHGLITTSRVAARCVATCPCGVRNSPPPLHLEINHGRSSFLTELCRTLILSREAKAATNELRAQLVVLLVLPHPPAAPSFDSRAPSSRTTPCCVHNTQAGPEPQCANTRSNAGSLWLFCRQKSRR